RAPGRVCVWSCQHALQGGEWRAAAVGGVPDVSPLLSAACQFAPAPGRTSPDQRQWLSQAVAARDPSDGRGADGSGLDLARGAVLSCAAMATAPEGLKNGAA